MTYSKEALEAAKDIRQELMALVLERGTELRLPAGHLAVMANRLERFRDEERAACAKVCQDDAHMITPDDRRATLAAGEIYPAAWQAARSATRIRSRKPSDGDLEMASWLNVSA